MRVGLIAFAILLSLVSGFCGGYRVGTVDTFSYIEKDRIAKMAHCAQTESLASTVHTDTGDIEICVSGSNHHGAMQ